MTANAKDISAEALGWHMCSKDLINAHVFSRFINVFVVAGSLSRHSWLHLVWLQKTKVSKIKIGTVEIKQVFRRHNGWDYFLTKMSIATKVWAPCCSFLFGCLPWSSLKVPKWKKTHYWVFLGEKIKHIWIHINSPPPRKWVDMSFDLKNTLNTLKFFLIIFRAHVAKACAMRLA